MKREEIIDGEVYWTCAPSIESGLFYNANPRPPYQAKAEWHERDVLYLHRFNTESGEIDCDANATAIVNPEYVYPDYRTAVLEHLRMVEHRISEMATEIQNLLNSVDLEALQ